MCEGALMFRKSYVMHQVPELTNFKISVREVSSPSFKQSHRASSSLICNSGDMNLECVTRAEVGITFWNNSVYNKGFLLVSLCYLHPIFIGFLFGGCERNYPANGVKNGGPLKI